MKPKVILYCAISLDGRTTGFPVDLGLFYSLAQQWGENASLVGSDTLLSVPDEIPEETALEPPIVASEPDDARPILAVADSRGRIRTWHYLKKQPYWRDWVALCTKQTPTEHLEYLRQRGVKTLIAGNAHVDFKQAFEELNRRFGVKVIRVDSGGTLNGVLLRAGLVDELHLLVHPCLVGGHKPKTFFTDPGSDAMDNIPLRLLEVKPLEEGLLLLSYSVAG